MKRERPSRRRFLGAEWRGPEQARRPYYIKRAGCIIVHMPVKGMCCVIEALFRIGG